MQLCRHVNPIFHQGKQQGGEQVACSAYRSTVSMSASACRRTLRLALAEGVLGMPTEVLVSVASRSTISQWYCTSIGSEQAHQGPTALSSTSPIAADQQLEAECHYEASWHARCQQLQGITITKQVCKYNIIVTGCSLQQ